MKKFFLFCILSSFLLSSYGQNLIDSNWKFCVGDNPSYAETEFNHSSWEDIDITSYWEKQNHIGLDGFAWYRKQFTVAANLKKQVKKMGGLILDLGTIDDSDEIFLNGEKIASHGKMPPEYETGYSLDRKIKILPGQIKWDAINVIAVRVYDGGGNGGIFVADGGLRIAGMEDLLEISINPTQKDHIFTNSQKVVFPVSLSNQFSENITGSLSYTIKSDFGEEILEHSENIKLRRKKSFTKNLVFENLNPGFYQVKLDFKSNLDNKSYSFRFGKDPEKIVSPTDRPDDFEDYWFRAKKELAAVAPQFKMIYQEEMSTPEREVYLVEMRSLGNVLIRGWYGKPRKEGVYPAILHVQGYSSNMKIAWAYQGNDMAVLALNVRGHGNSQDQVNPGFPGYLQHNLLDKETYIYRGAYMDCLRAVDFLFSRPEIDTTRIAVEGGSQGGALSFATAALDNERIALCVPHVPFLSDFRDYFRLVGWPSGEMHNFVRDNENADWETIYNTLSYIDIKNLAPWIKVPVFMSVGLLDDTCPNHINFAAYNQLNVEKEYIAFPWSTHRIDASWNSLKYEFIREKFGLTD